MSSYDYFTIKKFVGELGDLAGLNKKIENFMDMEPEDVDPNDGYVGFIQLGKPGSHPYTPALKGSRYEIQFWQGTAGDNADNQYYPNRYRTYGESEEMCQALSEHLSENGVIKVEIVIEGNDSEYYIITPGKFESFNPFD